ncbi:MAG: hypothetical protein PSX81_05300 [bacterium]|nr:hypothetical protein [bacterium]
MKIVNLENTWKVAHLFFLLLIGMSVFYAVERVCYMDSAYMFFRMVNTEKIIAEGGRWVNLLPQIIPWLMLKIGCSLPALILAFSIMHIGVLYLVFLLIGNWLNQKEIGLIFLLILILSVNETFFDVVTETKFSLAFASLFLAFILSKKRKHILIGFVILIGGFFSHPIFTIYFGFIVLFTFLFGIRNNIIKYALMGVLIAALKSLFLGVTLYENELLSAGVFDPWNLFANSFIHGYFAGLLSTQFVVIIGLVSLLLLNFILLRKWSYLSLYIISVFLLYFVLAVVYSKGDSHMMIQKTLFVFHFALLLPYFYQIQWSEFKLKKVFYLGIIIGYSMAVTAIIKTSEKYTQRVVILEQFMQHLPKSSDKFIMNENQINHEVIMGTWALPHETIIISKIKCHKILSIKNFRERNDTLFLSKYPNAFRPAFGYPIENKDLNAAYFKMKEFEPNIWLDSTYFLGPR